MIKLGIGLLGGSKLMGIENQDIKLKNLIQVCKESGNLKKLAVVSFILVSNWLNEIGIKLGTRERKRESESKETLVEYMEMINLNIQQNLGISVFQDKTIREIGECEQLFLRNQGNIPNDSIRTMYKVYFDLRKLDVPNLYKKLSDNDLVNVSQYGLSSFLSSSSKKRRNSESNNLKFLILQKIKKEQIDLQNQSKISLKSSVLEKAISLKRLQNSLDNNGKKKSIKFEGKLKDNLNYLQSIENIVGFGIIGVIILLFTLGMSMFLKLMTYPNPLSPLSYWALLLVGGGSILLLVYIKYFIRRKY